MQAVVFFCFHLEISLVANLISTHISRIKHLLFFGFLGQIARLLDNCSGFSDANRIADISL